MQYSVVSQSGVAGARSGGSRLATLISDIAASAARTIMDRGGAPAGGARWRA